MITHFMADPHFGHLLTVRNFSSDLEQDECLIEEINRAVPWNDRLFILGDFAKRSADSYLSRIHCRNVNLIWGNHDKGSFSRIFKTVADVTELKIQGHKFWLSHYAHAYWPASHRGSIHLYGHNHDQEEEVLDAAFPGRRSADCSVDSAYRLFGSYRPFNENEVLSMMLPRPGHKHSMTRKSNEQNLSGLGDLRTAFADGSTSVC